jgi:hypothetical protein
MKSLSLLALACLLAPQALLSQVYTTPVGYTTQTIKAGKYNLIGINVHGPTVTSGIFDSKPNSTSLADVDANFNTALTTGTYIIEITGNGSYSGAIQEFTTYTATEIQGLPTAFVAALNANEPYRIRSSATIASVFGEANEAGLLGGNANTADVILVPTGTGGFDSYYYSTGGFTGTGWRKIGGGATSYASEPIVYTDAIFIQRRGITDLELVLQGEVKIDKTILGISQNYQYVSTVFGSAPTLGASGLSASLLHGNANTADLVLMPNGSGGYLTYYYSNGGFTGIGWRLIGGGATDQAGVAMTPGIIINRRQAAFNATLTPPY